MTLRPCLVLASTLLFVAPASAQLGRPGRPASVRSTEILPEDVPALVLPHPDVERMRAEDDASPSGVLRYGAVVPVTFGCEESGRWDELSTGELVWRLHLLSPGARSLGVVFGEYEMPAGGQLFLHGTEDERVLGAFTREARQPNGMLAVEPVLGDELWIEYVQPRGVDAIPELRLSEVVHDYRGILDALRVDGQKRLAAGCLIDVNCALGAPYQDIKRSVIMVIAGGALCSAGLLNNTANDGTPYFLTANHCGNMTNVVAYFDYENTGCGAGGASTSKTISGATLLAAAGFFDSQLYRLSSTPPQSFNPFFAGWDRNSSQPAPSISISHPSGNPRKIAIDNEVPENTGPKWQVIWDEGTLEGGSSGSPLFNGAKRVIGPACCVNSFGCNGQWAYYGGFGSFYDKRNLGRFLDPLGTGSMTLEGHDPFRAQALPYNGNGTNPDVYTSTTLPSLGTTWNARIDATGFPSASSTLIIVHTSPSSGIVVSSGELLVNLGTPRVFQSVAPVSGGISLHSNAIPNDPLLSGAIGFSQGVLLLGGGARRLTNAIELRVR